MKENSIFDRCEVLENCLAYLAVCWLPGGKIPTDPAEREAFVQRIVSSYVTPLEPTADWNETLREEWDKEKKHIAQQMAIAATKIADEQDSQLVD